MANLVTTSEPTYCFLDTNVLIHKQTFDEVDWPSIVGATEVCLVLAPIVVKELDRHKADTKNEWVQNRARTLLSKLRTYLRDPQMATGQSVPVRSRVDLRYLTKEPAIDWTTLGLDAGWNDDRLIASIIEFIQKHPDAAVIFAADDTSCLAKALAHGIQTVDADRLPGQARTSPEADETAKLRRQIQDLTNRMPKLQLRFLEGGEPTAIACRSRTAPELPAEALDAFIAETLAREQHNFDAAMTRGRALLADNKLQPSELEQYEQEYTAYLHKLQAWLPMRWSREQGPAVDLWFVLDNSGTQPAADVRLTLTFPYGSFVTPRDDGSKVWSTVIMPKRPEAEWMKRRSNLPYAFLFDTPQLPLALLSPLSSPARHEESPKRTGPILSRDTPDRYIVTYMHPKLIQGGNWAMAPVRVYLPPSTGQGFTIAYQLRADELPTVITGTLPVRFTADEIAPLEG